jgi:hypothetical protein
MTDPKDYLRQMIDHTIDGDQDAASNAFKSFLVPKTMEVLGVTSNSPAADVVAEPAAEPAAAEPVVAEPAAEGAIPRGAQPLE